MCFMLIVISGTVTNAAAATNLPNSFLIGDQNGIQVRRDGEYYIEVNGVLPGQVIQKRLTIQNLDVDGAAKESAVPFNLAMRMEPVSETRPVALLDITRLELTLDGESIYSGRCRGDDGVNAILNTLRLGQYKPGDQRVLDIALTVDGDIDKELWNAGASEAKFAWIFYAWRETDAEPVETGGFGGIRSACLLLGGGALLWGTLLCLKKRKTLQEEQACP